MTLLRAPLALVLSSAMTLPNIVWAAPPPAAPGGESPDVSGMSDEDRMNRAKQLYGEADQAFNAGSYTEALQKFEEAYNVYAPSLHVFNINIGQAALELGDCVKAKAAFQRFLDLVPEHPGRQIAQEKLLEIERSGCAEAQPEPTPAETGTPGTTTTAPVLSDTEDAPILGSRRDEREEAAAAERRERESKKKGPLIISGAVLTALGGAALIGGGISAGLADAKANELADLASPGPTGFPSGNYGDDDVFNLDRNELPANNNATIALFVAGGVLAITGAALLTVGILRKKKQGGAPGSKNAQRRTAPRMVVAPSFLPGGGGGAATVRF